MRLIDADELQARIRLNYNNHQNVSAGAIKDIIGTTKTAVVNCKDCIHWADMCAECTEHVKLCTVGSYMVGENGYCVYGEKGIEHESRRKVL